MVFWKKQHHDISCQHFKLHAEGDPDGWDPHQILEKCVKGKPSYIAQLWDSIETTDIWAELPACRIFRDNVKKSATKWINGPNGKSGEESRQTISIEDNVEDSDEHIENEVTATVEDVDGKVKFFVTQSLYSIGKEGGMRPSKRIHIMIQPTSGWYLSKDVKKNSFLVLANCGNVIEISFTGNSLLHNMNTPARLFKSCEAFGSIYENPAPGIHHNAITAMEEAIRVMLVERAIPKYTLKIGLMKKCIGFAPNEGIHTREGVLSDVAAPVALFYKQKRASNLLILHLELECESEHHGMLETELTPHSVKSPTYPSNGQGGQRPTLGTARVGSSGAAANASTPGATYPLSGAGRTSTIDMNSIRVALGSITQDNVDVSKRITTVEKECALANQRMQSLEGKHIETAEQVASLEKENMEMNERMESMGNRVNELEGRMDGLISKVDEYADVEDLGDEVRRVEARLAHVETQINKSTTTSQNLLEMGETFRKQLNHLKKISEGQESLYQTLVRSVEDLRVYMMERIDGIDDIVGHKLDLENEIHRVRCDLDETASADELEMLLRNDVSLDSVNSKPKKAIENFYGRYFKTLREEIEDHFERSEEIFEDFSDIVSELSEDSKTGHVPVTPPPTYRSNYTNNIAQD